MRTKAYYNNKRITKYQIGILIENLPGNILWGTNSMMTWFIDDFTLEELAKIYNNNIINRRLTDEYKPIEIIKEG